MPKGSRRKARRSDTGRAGSYIYGIHPVREVLRAGRRTVHALTVSETAGRERIDEVLALASSRGIPVRRVEGSELAALFPDREDQGIALEAGPYPYCSLDDLLEPLPDPRMFAALDEIQDPGNLGAVVRSAAAFGCDGLIIHRKRSASVTASVVKASAGMTEHVRIAEVANLAAALRRLRDEGVWVIGLDAGAAHSVYNEDLTCDAAFVFGSEGTGLRRLTSELCDKLVSIPLKATCQSLNVSAAAAVVMAEAARQRISKNRGG